jgi:dTDP-glucose 4,6-dehydratase
MRLRPFRPKCGIDYRFAQGDICEQGLMQGLIQEYRPEYIVNFAAESHVDRSIVNPTSFTQANIEGVRSLLDTIREIQCVKKFIQVSTDEVYGDREGLDAANELDALRPSSPYSASKAAADLLCKAYIRTYGSPIVITRSSNNFGGFQYPEKMIPIFILQALRGKRIPIHGNGTHVRNWLYVEDNCKAIFKVMKESRLWEIYNIGTEDSLTTYEVMSAIITRLRRLGKLKHTHTESIVDRIKDRPGNDRTYAIDYSKIWEDLEWEPETQFQKGLNKTIKWYIENFEECVKYL